MGVRIHGLDELIKDLELLPERAVKAFTDVMGHAGSSIKKDWRARWVTMPHEHIPHLVKLISYSTDRKRFTFSVEVGITKGRWQSRLASFIEYGTLTSGPHPGGLPALEAETPKMGAAAQQVVMDLLNGKVP